MPDLTAKRTLVKSPPELWEELSEVERLAKHLGAFGEITITKLEPEHTVAWEGEHASGTVSIEPSGWGTKVTLRAELPEREEPEPAEPEPAEPEPPAPKPEPTPEVPPAAEVEAATDGPVVEDAAQVAVEERAEIAVEEPAEIAVEEPVAEAESEADPPRRGFWAWLFRPRRGQPEPVAEKPAVEAEPVADVPDAETEPVTHESTDAGPVVEEPSEPKPAAEEPAAATEPVAEEMAAEAEPVADEPVAEPEPVVTDLDEPEPVAEEPPLEVAEDGVDNPGLDPERARLILDEALDTLGAAHHRPFSRG
jgi:hypothetical protein